MIETAPFPPLAATALHQVTGDVDQQEAERGASEALQVARQLAATEGPLNLVLDLREVHFLTLQAHRAWNQGFARHSALQGLVRAVAIVGDDTPAFRGERELMETEQVRRQRAAADDGRSRALPARRCGDDASRLAERP